MTEPVFNDGFCWGHYETILEGVSRIRLGCDIIRELNERRISTIWLYASPMYPAIVLCPESCRDAYIKDAQTHFPPEMDPEIAYRKFIGTGRPAGFDAQGRVYIPVFCLKHSKIKKDEEIVIIGTGLWFEIWDPKKWEEFST